VLRGFAPRYELTKRRPAEEIVERAMPERGLTWSCSRSQPCFWDFCLLLGAGGLDRRRPDGEGWAACQFAGRRHSGGQRAGDDGLGQQRIMDRSPPCRCLSGWAKFCSARGCRRKCFADCALAELAAGRLMHVNVLRPAACSVGVRAHRPATLRHGGQDRPARN